MEKDKSWLQAIPTENLWIFLIIMVVIMAVMAWRYRAAFRVRAAVSQPPQAVLRAQDVPVASRTATGEDFVRRQRTNKAFRSGALIWVTHDRVDACAKALLSVEGELRKIVRDCNHVGTEQIKPTLAATELAMDKIMEAQLAIIPLKRALASLDPHAKVEVSLIPGDGGEEPIEVTEKDKHFKMFSAARK